MYNTTPPHVDENTAQIFWPLISYPYGVEALIVCHILTMLVSIPGNLLVITVILRSKNLLEETAYLLICSVSVADLSVSLLSQPVNIAFLIIKVERTSKFLNYLMFFLIWGFCGASAFGVVCITVDRYLYIMYPMHYTHMLSRQRAYIMISLQWTCGLLYGLLPMINIEESLFPTAVAALVTLICMTACMAIIYNKVHSNITRLQRADLQKTISSGSLSKRKQNNATITIMLIVLIFFLCWFPYIITNFVNAAWSFDNYSPIRAVYYWAAGLGCWNSAFNVIIYGFKNSTLRNEAKKFLRRKGLQIEPESFTRSRNSVSKNSHRINDGSLSTSSEEVIKMKGNKHTYSTFQSTPPSSSEKTLKTFPTGVWRAIRPKVLFNMKAKDGNAYTRNENSTKKSRQKYGMTSTQSEPVATVPNSSNLVQSLRNSHLKPPRISISESLPDLRKLVSKQEEKDEDDIRPITHYENIGYESDEPQQQNMHNSHRDTIKVPRQHDLKNSSSITLTNINILASNPIKNYLENMNSSRNSNAAVTSQKTNKVVPLECFTVRRLRAKTTTSLSELRKTIPRRLHMEGNARKSYSENNIVLEDFSNVSETTENEVQLNPS